MSASNILYLQIELLLNLFQRLKVDHVYTLFKAGHVAPPLCKNQPPVAGAIGWERSLFYRIKHTILRFQEIEDMLNSEQGKLVSSSILKCLSYFGSFVLHLCIHSIRTLCARDNA